MSPTAGPPSTRTISAVLPPSSLTGSTCATRVVNVRRCPAPQLSALGRRMGHANMARLSATLATCGVPLLCCLALLSLRS